MNNINHTSDTCANKMPLPKNCFGESDTAGLEGIGEVSDAASSVKLENNDLCADTLIALGRQQSSDTGRSSTTNGSFGSLTPAHGFSIASAGRSPPATHPGEQTWSADETPISTRRRSFPEASRSAAAEIPGSADGIHAETKAIDNSDATMTASPLIERDQSNPAAAPVLDGLNMGQNPLELSSYDDPSTASITTQDPGSSAPPNVSEGKTMTDLDHSKAKSVKRVEPCLRCRTYGEPVC